jgi:hypothetical protein
MVTVLDCQACHKLTSASRLRYFCGRPICDNCGAGNPDTRVHSVQTRDIFVHFTAGESCFAQAMDLDLHCSLGPRVPVSSPDTLRRLLAYLGARPAQLREVDSCLESHGQGNVRITLRPGCKNLMRLRG